MDTYSRALAAFLTSNGRTQEALAEQISRTQVAVSRYAQGKRFPDAETARKIHEATEGAVPFDVWQQVAAAKFLGAEAA